MASIVKRNKSFSVVYTSYEGGKKKQRWETYHSYEAALHRKEQVELVQTKQKERLQNHADNLVELLEEYVELYGRAHWSYSTYTNHVALIQNHILPAFGDMKLTEFSPKTIAVLYSKMRNQENMTPQILSSVHKVLHSAFEQAVLWEYADRNPFHKATLPKSFPVQQKCFPMKKSRSYCKTAVFLCLGLLFISRLQALCARGRFWR